MRLLYLALLAAFLPQQAPRAVLEGIVVREGTAQTVPRARVLLRRQVGTAWQELPPITTDEKGRFSFTNLAEGLYEAKVEASGYIGSGSSVELSAGETIRDMSIEITAVANVSGHIRDTSNQPLVNVPVQLLRLSYDSNAQQTYKSAGVALTNDRGEYRLYWVTPGRYYLLAGRPSTGADPMAAMTAQSLGRVTASGNQVARILGFAFYPGVADLANARTLDLQPGSDLQIDLALTPKPRTFTFRGKVIDSRTGQPPARASVFVSTPMPGVDPATTIAGIPGANYTSATGAIQIRDLLPGTYTVTALVQGPSISVGTIPVTVATTDIDEAVISVVPAATIQGRLRLEGQFSANTTVERLQVALLPIGANSATQAIQNQMSGFSQRSAVNPDGTFRLNNIVPGDYRVSVTPYYDGFLKEARYGATDALTSPLHVSNAIPNQLDLIIAAAVGKLAGTVTDARSQPVQYAEIVIVPERGRHRPELFQRRSSGENGRFTLSDVAPGDYRVYAWESIEEYSWFDPEVLAKFETRGTFVHVSESSSQDLSLKVIPVEAKQ